MNGNGRTDAAECATAIFPVSAYQPTDYSYRYLFYSTGINFRASLPLALFSHYTRGVRGVRGAAEAILVSPALDANGNLVLGVVSRSYRAYGAELEGSIRRGPFSVTASGTLAKADITGSPDPTLVGNTPRHQPTFIYQVTPQYDVDRFSIGANVVGVTGSYASDANVLRLPAYTTVGLFAQFAPVEKLVLSVNASNIFNTLAITETLDDAIPAGGVVLARPLYGRTISASARVFF